MILIKLLFFLSICYSLKFSDRNQTHLLFEYCFLQNDCENGSFPAIEYESGMSFGSLLTNSSLQCLDRSGYKSIGVTNGYAFESNATIHPFLTRINNTYEFSIEGWMKIDHVVSYSQSVFSISIVNKELYLNNAFFFIVQLDEQLVAFSTNILNQDSYFRITEDHSQTIHFVSTFKMIDNTTYFQSYINGELERSSTSPLLNLNAWNEESRFYGSFPGSIFNSYPRWEGEVYYLGFYDHALREEQVMRNYNCSFPPSIPSIQQHTIHGNMNSIFPVEIIVYDYNSIVSGNTSDDIEVYLISLPHRGFLYSSTMSIIQSLPSSGLLLSNTTLFYEPISGEFNTSVYTEINVKVKNTYGISNPKTISIYVDWVNSPPITHDLSFHMNTHEVFSIDIDIIDIDNDKNYTQILYSSPECSILTPSLFYSFTLSIQYIGGNDNQSNNTCIVQFVVGDRHGLESNLTTYTFFITNEIQPIGYSFIVNQGENSTISPVSNHSDCILQVITSPTHGQIVVQNNSFLYLADSWYFSSPSTTIYNQDLHNPHESCTFLIIHKGITSLPFTIQLIIQHINTLPILSLSSSVSFQVYDPVYFHDIFILDMDNDTQLCSLKITTNTGFFVFNTTTNNPENSLEWKDGNYGEGMDDNLVIVQGSISAMNKAFQSLVYRAVYRLNDTMQIILTDGNLTVSGIIQLIYTAEETTTLTTHFYMIMICIYAFLILCFLLLIINCCKKICKCFSKCKREKRKLLKTRKEHEKKTEIEIEKKSTRKPKDISSSRISITKSEKPMKNEISSIPKQSTTVVSTPLKKKIPPPLPKSPPPVKKTPPTLNTQLVASTPDNIEPYSRKSSKPPSVI